MFRLYCLVILIYFTFSPVVSLYALSVEDIIRLKEAGVDDRTIQMLIQQEKTIEGDSKGLGVKEIKRSEGGSDKIYYSIITPEEEEKSEQEEREKREKSWEMLKNVIIDDRKK
jgi:hypothetical protein